MNNTFPIVFRKSGQSTVEFLVIFAVILLLLIVLVLGVFEFRFYRSIDSSHHFWKSSSVGILSYAVSQTNISVVLSNKQSSPVIISGLTVEDVFFAVNVTLLPTQTARVIINHTFVVDVSDIYSHDIRINYTLEGLLNSIAGPPIKGTVWG
jgi:hypothetical protein